MSSFEKEELDVCRKLADVQKRQLGKQSGIIEALRLELEVEKKKRKRPTSNSSLRAQVNKLRLLRNRFDVEALILIYNMQIELKRLTELKRQYNGIETHGRAEELIGKADEWLERQPEVPSLPPASESTSSSTDGSSTRRSMALGCTRPSRKRTKA